MSASSPKVVVITGAGSGIGSAIVRTLSAPQTILHLAGRSAEKLEAVAAAAREAGAETVLHAVDLNGDEGIDRLAREVEGAHRRLDVLVHSAGAVALGPVKAAPVADLDRQYAVNVRAPYALTRRFLPLLEAAKGQIVFLNSGGGLHARPGWSQYAITKHGLRALADSLREELKGSGVRVLSVFPGRTATPMQAEVHRMEGKDYDPKRFIQPEDIASQIRAALTLPRTAEVTDLILRPAE